MRRLPLWWWLLGCALASCGKAHSPSGPSVDSETHFLTPCTQSCADGLSCVCGVCTTICAVDDDCKELSGAAHCVESSPAGAQSCDAAPALACDMSCERDADCASLSGSHLCDRGSCRRPAPASHEPAGPSELPYARGGQRLKALHYVAEGVEQFRDLYDDELGFACEFAPDATGSGVHCVPKAQRAVIYLDSGCQQPATAIAANDVSRPGTMPGDWLSALVTEPAAGCANAPAASRVSYRIGERVFEGGQASIGVTPPTVYASRDAACVEIQLQTALLLPAVHRIEPQDPNQLIAGQVSTIEVGGGLAVRRVIADDDTQITIGIVGLGGAPCSLQQGGACVPDPVTVESGGFFLDAECEQPGFWSPTATPCAEADFGVRTVDDVAHVYELTPARTVFTKKVVNPLAPPGTDFEYSCESVALDSLETEYAAKVSMPSREVTATLPSASTLQTGRGPLHLNRFVATTADRDADHFVALDGGGPFIDDQVHSCQVQETVDGSLRCLAQSDQITEAGHWKDASCNERLYTATEPAVDSSLLRVARFAGDGNAPKLEALTSLTPYEGPTFQVIQTRCVSAPTASTTPLFALDADIPLATLPSVESAEL